METMSRREYTKEFKQEAVALSYRQGGAKAAQSPGIAANIPYHWHREAQTEGSKAFRGKGKLRAERAEGKKFFTTDPGIESRKGSAKQTGFKRCFR